MEDKRFKTGILNKTWFIFVVVAFLTFCGIIGFWYNNPYMVSVLFLTRLSLSQFVRIDIFMCTNSSKPRSPNPHQVSSFRGQKALKIEHQYRRVLLLGSLMTETKG